MTCSLEEVSWMESQGNNRSGRGNISAKAQRKTEGVLGREQCQIEQSGVMGGERREIGRGLVKSFLLYTQGYRLESEEWEPHKGGEHDQI